MQSFQIAHAANLQNRATNDLHLRICSSFLTMLSVLNIILDFHKQSLIAHQYFIINKIAIEKTNPHKLCMGLSLEQAP